VASDELVDVRTDGEGPHEAQRAHVEILVLGPVDVAGGEIGAVEPSRRMAALGLLAYMASHDRPVSADQLAGSLWPLDATKDNVAGPQRKTVMNVISRARAVLGYGAGGHERLVHTPQGYRLAEDVSSDWARFEKLVGRARSQPPHQAMAVLRRALELVRGEPFSGALSSQFFEWVASEHLDLTFSAKIVDVAQDLGELALEAEDYETVLWAVEKGLLLEPTREEMFRLWMHALGRMGRPGGVDDVYRRLKLVLRQRIHPLQEPQPGSYSVWRTYTAGELTRTPG
jgi:DNA-binding SARP family transcriptional activator